MSQTAKHTTSMVGDLGPVSTLTLFQKYAFSVSSRAHRSIRVHTTVLMRFRLPHTKTFENDRIAGCDVSSTLCACYRQNENYRRTSLIRTPKGQSEVSGLERCPYKRGHLYILRRRFYDSTNSFKCSVAKTRLTHLKLLIHSTKASSFNSTQHSTSQLQTNYCYCFKTKRATAQCCM